MGGCLPHCVYGISIPGVEFAELFYKQLEIEKSEASKIILLKEFQSNETISHSPIGDVQWWLNSAILSKRHKSHGPIDLEVATDASKQGWGDSLGESVTGRRWSLSESSLHINEPELKAVLLGLQSLCKRGRTAISNYCLIMLHFTMLRFLSQEDGRYSVSSV